MAFCSMNSSQKRLALGIGGVDCKRQTARLFRRTFPIGYASPHCGQGYNFACAGIRGVWVIQVVGVSPLMTVF